MTIGSSGYSAATASRAAKWARAAAIGRTASVKQVTQQERGPVCHVGMLPGGDGARRPALDGHSLVELEETQAGGVHDFVDPLGERVDHAVVFVQPTALGDDHQQRQV